MLFRKKAVEKIHQKILVYFFAKELLETKIGKWIDVSVGHRAKIRQKKEPQGMARKKVSCRFGPVYQEINNKLQPLSSASPALPVI
jgi:hypothetical protein